MDGVVPVAVPVVSGQGQGVEVGVADVHAEVVGVGVEFGVDGEAGSGGGCGDGLDDDFVTGQGSAAPVHRDVGEQSVLDFIPLAGSGW